MMPSRGVAAIMSSKYCGQPPSACASASKHLCKGFSPLGGRTQGKIQAVRTLCLHSKEIAGMYSQYHGLPQCVGGV